MPVCASSRYVNHYFEELFGQLGVCHSMPRQKFGALRQKSRSRLPSPSKSINRAKSYIIFLIMAVLEGEGNMLRGPSYVFPLLNKTS